MGDGDHIYISKLREDLASARIDRREFLRLSTLLGLSATAAFGFADKVCGSASAATTKADLPLGGMVRIQTRLQEIDDVHAISWGEASQVPRQVVEHLARTHQDNITRPHLLDAWEVSEDLRTWTLRLRRDVRWRRGRLFHADDVVWNITRILDPATGSSVVGLMQSYMLQEVDTGKLDKDGKKILEHRLWDANAVEKVDDFTVRLNLREPQIAVPEHLYHFPFVMLDPEEGGKFGPSSNGTGPFTLVDYAIGEEAVLEAVSGYWGEGPYLDTLEFVDLGEDESAWIAALWSGQVHGLREVSATKRAWLKDTPDIVLYSATAANTGVARMQVDKPPFNDPRVRKAFKLAIDPAVVLKVAHADVGLPAEHHHVCSVHPDYAELPQFERDLDESKRLLAEAGFPNGLDTEISCKNSPPWEVDAVQAMKEQWAEAGIRVSINVLPATSYWDIWTKVPFGFTSWSHRPLGIMVLGLAYRSGAPWNESHYANPAFDALLSKAEQILDAEERREAMAEIERLLQEDGPIVQPLWRGTQTAYSNRVKGFVYHPGQDIFGEQLAIEPA